MNQARKLSNIQLELLKVFSFDLSEEQLAEIKDLLSKYFANKVTTHMDKLFEENNWGDEKIDEWSKEHMRTKYNGK
ncbi:MAG: hypothetical protein WAU01_16375 [Saprospiraceae bacterium]